MYQDIETCIANNGHASDFFEPRQCITQSCSISANLFVIIVELLANAICKKRITGITIDNVMYKIAQYADDSFFSAL
jgi:hypothetical protein